MSGAGDDDEDLEPAPFILMRAEETFDGQERVFSRPAYDLQVRATSHSATCGHPGYVPDDYLEHLDGLGIETTITAAELCAIGTWERTGEGYRILDWEAVEYALDQVRQRTGEDPRPSPPTRNTRPRSRPAWPSRSWSLRRARYAEPLQLTSSSWPSATCPPGATNGRRGASVIHTGDRSRHHGRRAHHRV